MADVSILEKAVAELLTKAISAAEAAGKFAVDQLPDIAQQFVLYVGIISSVWTVVGLLFFVSPLFLFHCFKKWNRGEVDENVVVPTVFIGGVLSIVGMVCIMSNFGKMILAFFAPKILLIQFAAELLK